MRFARCANQILTEMDPQGGSSGAVQRGRTGVGLASRLCFSWTCLVLLVLVRCSASGPPSCPLLCSDAAGARPWVCARLPFEQLRLRGGHRNTGFKRRKALEKFHTSRRIHSIYRPRSARKAAERQRARLEAEECAGKSQGLAGDASPGENAAEQPRTVNRNLFRRNMGELLVDIEKFRKAHPHVYEEELNTRLDTQARHFVDRWRETLEMPEDDEEELDRWQRHPDWIKRRGIAHYNLAMCHDTGYVVGTSQISATTAFFHYHAAAELGHVEAMCCTGSCYMYGRGVSRDVALAADWYVRAANKVTYVGEKIMLM